MVDCHRRRAAALPQGRKHRTTGSHLPEGVLQCAERVGTGRRVPPVRAIDNLRFSASVAPVSLSIQPSGSDVILSWPLSAVGYALQSNGSLTQPDAWAFVGQPIIPVSGFNTVTVPATNSPQYFRL